MSDHTCTHRFTFEEGSVDNEDVPVGVLSTVGN